MWWSVSFVFHFTTLRGAACVVCVVARRAQVAKCRLHSAVALTNLGRHRDAIKYLDQVLGMVEEGRLETGGVSAQKLCLIAVAYHNRAVEYMLFPPSQVRTLSTSHTPPTCTSSLTVQRC